MAVASDSTPPASAPPQGPANGRARAAAALSLGKRFLTLREGSIIVVTLITFVYFATSTDRFLTGASFKALLPYFAPFAILAAGEVFVMINGEIDLSIGAVYLFTPFVFYKLSTRTSASPLRPGADPGAARRDAGRPVQRRCGLGRRDLVVRRHARDAVHVRRPDADHLPRDAGHHPRARRVVKVGTFAQVFGGGTYSELFWAIGIVLVLQIVLSFTRWGIYTVAVGGNRLGAAEAGVRRKLVLIRNFVLCATLAGFVGILEAVRAATDDAGSVRGRTTSCSRRSRPR